MMKPNRKTLVTAISFLLIGIIATSVVWVYASPSTTFTLSGGVYPSADSYTIWREGVSFFAKNAWGFIPSWGESSNATAIIDNAKDSLTSGNIFLKDATYPDLSPIIWKSNINLIGESKYGTILEIENSIGSGFLIVPANSERILFESFTIDGNSANQGGGSHNLTCIVNDDVYDVTFKNMHFTDFVGEAISSTSGGIYDYPRSSNIKVLNCDFDNIQSSNETYVIFLRSNNCVIDGNRITSIGEHGGWGIRTGYSNNSRITNNIVNGTAGGISAWLYDDSRSEENIISNNHVLNLYSIKDNYWAILMYGAGIVSNNLVQNTSRDAIVCGYWFEGGGEFVVSDNVIQHIGDPVNENGVGIWIHGQVDGGGGGTWSRIKSCTVTGNVVYDAIHGITITYANYTTVTGNTIRENVRYGLTLANSFYCVVDSNVIVNSDSGDTSTYDGLYVAGSYNIISDNISIDNDRNDIWIPSGYERNIVTGCSTYGSNSVVGILDEGTNNNINLCWNQSTWIA